MSEREISRREFIEGAAALAGGVLLPAALRAAEKKPPKRTATDQVPLGKTGLKICRLGFGTGSHGGSVQRRLGTDGLSRLIRYAYDRGITYIDTADNYRTHTMIRQAIKSLPREKLFIQSKMRGVPEKPMEVLDRFRKELGTDYIDSLLLHARMSPTWDRESTRAMDALEEAKAKKIIRAHGVSCHGIHTLTRTADVDWVEVAIVRINPQGACIDTRDPKRGYGKSTVADVAPAVKQLRRLHGRRCGTIAMKVIGNGTFTKAEDREKSIRFVMQCGLLDAAAIGFKNTAEIDEAIERINRALAAPAAAADDRLRPVRSATALAARG